MRYSISKFRDFSRIFSNFLGTFQIFSIFMKIPFRFSNSEIYKNATPIFKVKNYKNIPLIYRNF